MKQSKLMLSLFLMGIVLAGCAKDSTTQSTGESTKNQKTTSTSSLVEVSENQSTVESTLEQVENTTSTESDEPIETKELDEEALLNGDYSSMDGTWTNTNGYQVAIENGVITLLNNDIGGETQYSLSKPESNSNVIFLSFEPAPLPNGMSLIVVKKGTSPSDGTEDATDSSRDRFIMGNNGGTTLFRARGNGGISDTAYYRDN